MADDGPKYNMNNPSVKRILREMKEMEQDKNPQYTAAPLEDNIFEWHFTMRGPRDSPFEGGIYHGRILLPPEYPFKPPNIMLLTPNGRFEVGKKICLSISAHHPEHWQASWSIRTIITALIGFMPSKGEGAIGALDYTAPERITLATKSKEWSCPRCGIHNATALPEDDFSTATTTTTSTTTSTSTSTTPSTTSVPSTTPSTTNVPSSPQITSATIIPPRPSYNNNTNEGMETPHQKQTQTQTQTQPQESDQNKASFVENFALITGAPPKTAKEFLEKSNWNFDDAIIQYESSSKTSNNVNNNNANRNPAPAPPPQQQQQPQQNNQQNNQQQPQVQVRIPDQTDKALDLIITCVLMAILAILVKKLMV